MQGPVADDDAKLADDGVLGLWFSPRRDRKPCRHRGVGVPQDKWWTPIWIMRGDTEPRVTI